VKYVNLVTAAVFVLFVFGLALWGLFRQPTVVSMSERRVLAQFPEISTERLFDGIFAEEYVTFLQDQAVLRDDFRALKSFVERKVLMKLENNGVYVVGGNIYDKFYGVNQSYIERAAISINNIIASIDSDRIYLSVIPSKAQMLDRDKYLLSDQSVISDYLARNVDAAYIDLMGLAERGNEGLYYVTDHHWTTEGAIRAYDILAVAMGYDPITEYELEMATDSYAGSNYGKAAAKSIQQDSIYLAHNELLDSMVVWRYETLDSFKRFDSIYFREEIDGLDPYDVFIGGLGPITIIENPLAAGAGELVVFKDSYSHVLAPFLAQHFEKVTLFDLRYVRKEWIFGNFDLSGKTVLFIYSTTILNTDPQIVD
jgi:hypothetical protein